MVSSRWSDASGTALPPAFAAGTGDGAGAGKLALSSTDDRTWLPPWAAPWAL